MCISICKRLTKNGRHNKETRRFHLYMKSVLKHQPQMPTDTGVKNMATKDVIF